MRVIEETLDTSKLGTNSNPIEKVLDCTSIYVYDFCKHNEILEREYNNFKESNSNFLELFLSTELKSILIIRNNIIEKFIHESFMEFFIAKSIIRELLLDYEEINFNILSYYYRYEITRFILDYFEILEKNEAKKISENLINFINQTIKN